MMIDEFYCLNLVETRNRYSHCVEQFRKLEIPVKFWYTTRRPIMQMIGTQINGIQTDAYKEIQETHNPFTFGAVFSCVFEHYNIMKQAYERGLNNIVIFEDDINFKINAEDFRFCLSKIPNDYSVCKFHYSYENVQPFDKDRQIFIQTTNYSCMCSTLSYAISRKGMNEYISAFENKEILCADLMFRYLSKVYINNVKICEPAGFRSAINEKI